MFHVEQIDVLAARRKAPEKPGVSRETFRWERFRRLPYLGIARGHPQKRAVIVRRTTLQGEDAWSKNSGLTSTATGRRMNVSRGTSWRVARNIWRVQSSITLATC
jgi:hypothetical protein